jgi:hypothetical protein
MKSSEPLSVLAARLLALQAYRLRRPRYVVDRVALRELISRDAETARINVGLWHFSEVLECGARRPLWFKTRTWANRRDRARAHWKSGA